MHSVFRYAFGVFLIAIFKCSVQGVGVFPQLLTDNQRYRYFSVRTGYRLRLGKIDQLTVIDEISCVRKCMEMEDKCTAVNVASTPRDGLHLCEIMKNNLLKKEQKFVADGGFNSYSLQVN